MTKKLALKIGILLTLLMTPLICAASSDTLLAQVRIDPSLKPEYAAGIEVKGGTRVSEVNLIMQLLAGSLIYLAGPIAVFMIALGGLRYVMSRGDQTQMEEAKKTLTFAIIGLVVIVLSYAIISNIIRIAIQPDLGVATGTDISTQEQAATETDKTPSKLGE